MLSQPPSTSHYGSCPYCYSHDVLYSDPSIANPSSADPSTADSPTFVELSSRPYSVRHSLLKPHQSELTIQFSSHCIGSNFSSSAHQEKKKKKKWLALCAPYASRVWFANLTTTKVRLTHLFFFFFLARSWPLVGSRPMAPTDNCASGFIIIIFWHVCSWPAVGPF